jgi:SAM-dependent methyltransferase
MTVDDRTADVAVQVRQLFDAKAAAWPSKYAQDGRLARRLTRLASAVSYHMPTGGNVLDLGCGTGELAAAMADAGMRATGCDISPEMLSRAAALDSAGVLDWVQLDPGWSRLPFEPDTFDAVVAASVLEYVDHPAAVLHECCRVLRPGGVVLCTVPDPRHPIRWAEWLLGVAVRVPLIRVAGRRWPRLGGYMTYLHISRHRHSCRWWRAAAAQGGLLGLDVCYPADSAKRSALRLVTLQRTGSEQEMLTNPLPDPS